MKYNVYEINDPVRSEAETLILLGFPATSSGQPGFVLQSRLETALAYLRQHTIRKIIVTGRATHNRFEEAEVQKNYLIRHGIAENMIIKETDSANTPDNALYSYRITEQLQLSNIVVVTSHYHRDRVQYIFSHYFQSFKIITPVAGMLSVLRHSPYYMWDKYALYRIKRGDERLNRK